MRSCYYFSPSRALTLDGTRSKNTDSGIETITEKGRKVFIINVGQWFMAEGFAVPHTALKLTLKARKDAGVDGKKALEVLYVQQKFSSLGPAVAVASGAPPL